MGERTTYGRDPRPTRNMNAAEHDAFGDATGSSGRAPQPYRFGRQARGQQDVDESMPMFLTGYETGDDEQGFDDGWVRERRRMSMSSRVLLAVVAAAGVAVLFALVTSDATRDLIATAKASMIGATQDPSAPPQPDKTLLTARDLQLSEPAAAPSARPTTLAAVSPSREEIANAYQSALQNRATVEPTVAAPNPALPSSAVAPSVSAPSSITAPGAATAIVAPPAAAPSLAAPAPIRRMDPDELAMIMKRAKSLLSAGDIPSARLLLERAADAQEAIAALLLAQTYDPQVLGTKDIRNINADPATARNWYRRAAQLGSAEAQRRLDQLPN